MNFRNPLTILFCALLGGQAHAAVTPFQFNGKPYAVAAMGRSVKVAPAAATAHLSPLGGDESAGTCDAIYAELQRKAYLFDDCREKPDLSICKVLVKSLRLLAEGRPDTDTPIDRTAVKTWSLAAPTLEGVDADALRAAVAEKLRVRPAQVEVVSTGAKPRVAGTPIYLMEPGSASDKVSKLLSFRLEDLGQFQGSDRLVTKNTIFACDIAQGHASLVVQGVSTLRSVDHVPDEVVDTAWDVYRELDQNGKEVRAEGSPLVRSALIGYHIGATLARHNAVDDPLATPSALFRRLHDLSGNVPELREASSREALRSAVYPDVSFEETLPQSWSVK